MVVLALFGVEDPVAVFAVPLGGIGVLLPAAVSGEVLLLDLEAEIIACGHRPVGSGRALGLGC